jgi:hypothetical protein
MSELLEKGYDQMWVCKICLQPYEKEEDAKLCFESHEELKMEPEFVLGDPLPHRVVISRIKGSQIIAHDIYVKLKA